MTEQVWEWGGKRANKKLVRVMAENSTDAVTWLENLGIRWLDRIFVSFGGAFPRAHTSNLIRGGYEYFSAINRAVRKLNVKVLLNTEATELLVNSKGEIRGVSANRKGRKILFETRAVVLATGGFSANPEMVRRYSRLPVPSVHTTANPDGTHFDGATGDGIRMGMAVGADVVDMDCIEFMPIRGGRLLDYVGGDIFVNAEGRRFVNEGGTRSELTTAVARQPGQFMWAITDDRSDKGDTLENKLISGEVQQAATVEEMASKMRVSPSVLKQTIDRYNEFARQGKDPDFGKTTFTQTINHPPYFFGKDRLDVHYTVGGLRINERAEVLNTNGQPIAGLWGCRRDNGRHSRGRPHERKRHVGRYRVWAHRREKCGRFCRRQLRKAMSILRVLLILCALTCVDATGAEREVRIGVIDTFNPHFSSEIWSRRSPSCGPNCRNMTL